MMNTTTTKLMHWLLAVAASLAITPACAAFTVFACEPEWGALAKELGGERVSVYVATTAMQDPHRIEARPSLIARARSADLLVCTGADLEAGWLPLVQTQSANPAIQPGRPGFFEAARTIRLLEPPQRIDRSLGDVHASGNPHIHLDPRNIAAVAAALAQRMAELDPTGANEYQRRTKTFLAKWQEAIGRWEGLAVRLKGMAVIVHHRDLTYLLNWLSLREVGALEPKPGVPPTPTHLSALVARLEKDPAKAIIRSAYSDPRASEWLSERTKITAITLPYTVGGSDRAKDLFGLFDDTLERLLALAR